MTNKKLKHIISNSWVATSYAVSAMIYTVGSWWWTLFIWLAVIALIVTFIVLRNIGKFDIVKIFKRKKV